MPHPKVGFGEGDRIEARFEGKDEWYEGKIIKAHSNGTFDVLYDDGDEEKGVERRLIRDLANGFEEGDRVQVRFEGKGEWYEGKITDARSDGTFDVLYEDGDTEERVEQRLIRRAKRGVAREIWLDGTRVACVGGLMNYPSDPRDANTIYAGNFGDIYARP